MTSLHVTGVLNSRVLGSKGSRQLSNFGSPLSLFSALEATTPYELDQPIILVKVIEESYMSASGVSYWLSDRVHQIGIQVRNNTSRPPLQHFAYTACYHD